MRLDGKVALITGGGSGIGRGIAESFAAEGARVAVSGRRAEPLDETAGSISAAGGEALAISGHDVSDPADCRAMVDATVENFGRLDVLVNNAAIYRTGNTLDTSEDEYDRLFNINVKGAWQLCREAVSRFDGAGTILNIASVAGLNPIPGVGVYVLTKATLIMLTKQLALELADQKVRVNCICPGVVETPIFETIMDADAAKAFLAETAPGFHPLGRVGKTSDIAAAAVYLCGDESDWVTGAVLPVSGGQF